MANWLILAKFGAGRILNPRLLIFFQRCMHMTTVPAQIERRRSNFRPGFFGAVAFKFEPIMTVLIKNLAQKVDFWANCCSNQDCRSICAGTVYLTQFLFFTITYYQ